MAKEKREIVPGLKVGKIHTPGSIYKPKTSNTLYIKFKGHRFSTGLPATKEGLELAKLLLKKKYLDFNNLQNDNCVMSYLEAWKTFEKTLITKSEKTIANYHNAFKSIITQPNEYLTVDNCEQFILSYLKNTTHGKVTINTYLNNLQIFLNYCTDKNWIDKTKFKAKYSFMLQQGHVQMFTNEECCKLIRYFINNKFEIAYLIIFMLETGARVVDALTLEWSQIDFANQVITWKNKISKFDEPRVASSLSFKILRKLHIINKKSVFSWKYNASSRLAHRLNEALEKLGIEKNGRSFQEFRVTFRMRMMKKGFTEDQIKYLLRHSTKELIYNHYTDFNVINTELKLKLK